MNIKQALATLDPKNDDQWTGDGAPRIDVVSKLTKRDLKRSDITNSAPDFTRATAGKEPEAEPEKEAADGEGSTDEKEPEAKVEPEAEAQAEAVAAPVEPPVPFAMEEMAAAARVEPETEAAPIEMPTAEVLAEPLTELESRQIDLEVATKVMIEAQKRLGQAKRDADLAADTVNDLNRKIDLLHKVDPNHATAGIRAYLKQQNANRMARAGRVEKFLGGSGVTMRDLNKQFDHRAPIDAAMAGRKPARGTVRPAVRPIG